MEPAKRRILFMITTADWGGAQRFVFDAARECIARGHDVLVAKGGHGELGEKCSAAGIPSVTVESLRRNISPIHDLRAICELRRVIRTFRPDVVHLNSSKIGVIGSIACKRERVPRVIYRIGGWVFTEQISPLKRVLYVWAERWTAKLKDVIVTVHPGDEALARQIGITPRERIVTIPNGIDIATFDRTLLERPAARTTLGISDDRFVIGTIANFYPPKNIPWLLETIAATPDDPRRLFVIIGNSGPEAERVKKMLADRQLEGRVKIVARPTDASSFLSAFDVFILPSTKEGMPWVLLEAMAARLPCIATDVGACRWMLEPDAGIVIPPNDANALLSAIADLHADQTKRTALGAVARLAIESRFTWARTIEQTMRLFE